MMTTQECYWALLRKAIWNTQENICMDSIDMDTIVSISRKQGTAPLIFDQLLKTLPQAPSHIGHESMKIEMKQVCMQNMMLQEQMQLIMQKTLGALSKEKVQPIVLKGFALAALYPQSYLRQWGDIDIFVGDVAYHQTAEILRNTFPNCACYEEEEEYFKHWNIDVDNTSIEAHRVSAVLLHPCDQRLWYQLERTAMAQSEELEIERLSVRVPELKWNILFVFLHSWQHYTESYSAKVQQLCDLALLLHSAASLQAADATTRTRELYDYLKKNLRKLRLTQVWQAYAHVMVHYLGLPADECPLYTTKAAKRGETLLKNILGYSCKTKTKIKTTTETNIILRKMNTLHNKIKDSMQTWEISPIYAIHDVIGKVLEGLSRLLRGEFNRKWE